MNTNPSVEFFDTQFKQQITTHDFALNPFELKAVPYLRGKVLDFGCGMGNLAVYAARAKHQVVALDASPAAIAHLRQVALDEALTLRVTQADLRTTQLHEAFDTVVSIGLLMFFDCQTALQQLEHLKSLVRPEGVAIINVLTSDTTFMSMFSPQGHCLFGTDDLLKHFAGWQVLLHDHCVFPAAGDTVKAFATLIAQRPRSV
jgi:tellurite methyltransferase